MGKRPHPPRFARAFPGGLRSQARREAWWRQAWIAWLEHLRLGARLGRGRSYAQQGQIRSLVIEPGKVSAEVQGAEETPYRTGLAMPPLDAGAVLKVLDAHPVWKAQIVANTLPIACVEALKEAGLRLFPEARGDVRFLCTCKDWARPCKHVVALIYLFADIVGVEPRNLFLFRGVTLPDEPPALTPALLPPEAFARLHPSQNVGAIPKRLGTLPYWRGAEDFIKTLGGGYERAQRKASLALEGQHVDFRFPEDVPPEFL